MTGVRVLKHVREGRPTLHEGRDWLEYGHSPMGRKLNTDLPKGTFQKNCRSRNLFYRRRRETSES